MARAFYLRGHEHVVAPVAEQLRLWRLNDVIAEGDLHAEADRFTHMLRSGVYEQHLLGIRRRATASEITQHVAAAVRVFLGGMEARSA